MYRVGFEPATYDAEVQRANHYTTETIISVMFIKGYTHLFEL